MIDEEAVDVGQQCTSEEEHDTEYAYKPLAVFNRKLCNEERYNYCEDCNRKMTDTDKYCIFPGSLHLIRISRYHRE